VIEVTLLNQCIITDYLNIFTKIGVFIMTISKKDIEKIAHLARINISQGETAKLEKKLDGIMTLIDKMQSINTDNIQPMSHALDISQPLRKDEVTESDVREKILPLAPETEKSLFIVPQVIE
tara:strand:+ start:419 stop:784 length:366 start_codon:yes stop_codon:yes gene_type:complete